MEHHLYATLLALAAIADGYAHAIARTLSGSTYVVEMTPYGVEVQMESRTIGSRDVDLKDAYIHHDRLHLVGVHAYDSVVTSPITDLEVRSGSMTFRPNPADQARKVIDNAFPIRF